MIHGIARLEFCHLRSGKRLLEARIADEIRLLQGHHADGLTREREMNGSDIKIANLIGRKEGKASAATHNTGDIVRDIVVSRDSNRIADPNPRNGRRIGQINRILVLRISANTQGWMPIG